MRLDLLRTELEIRYLQEPSRLRTELALIPHDQLVIIDEIQKVPALLDEVHFLIQEESRLFGLCGSSARKVRHGHANLLGGRALRYELLGLTMHELGEAADLLRMLNHGNLPTHYLAASAHDLLRSYVEDYLKQEILTEGLVRRLPQFTDFLRSAALGDSEQLSLASIARDCGVAATTVRDHYSILVDTLLGDFLPAYTKRPKRRVISAPTFYFHDVGIVNHLARRGRIEPGSELFGKAFENWIHHELYCYSRYSVRHFDLSYWRLTTGVEVDFIVGDGELAIEVKGKKRITSADAKHLPAFRQDHPEVKKLILVCCEDSPRVLDGDILVLPWQRFVTMLWSGELTSEVA